MRLQDQCETALRYAVDSVQAVQHADFPQRPVHVHRLVVVLADEARELPPRAGFRQTAVLDVILDVEMLVVDPVGVVEFERNPHQAAPKDRADVQSASHVFDQGFQIQSCPLGLRWAVDQDRSHVCEAVFRVRVQKLRILGTELFHRRRPRLIAVSAPKPIHWSFSSAPSTLKSSQAAAGSAWSLSHRA